MSIRFVASLLLVQDMAVARDFYERFLGQEVYVDHGENVAFQGFALHDAKHFHALVFDGSSPVEGPQGRDNLELYFETMELDEVWARAQAEGIPLVHPLREQPWGQRVFRCYDPDRHIVEIAEPMPMVILRYLKQGMTVTEVVAKTSMPIDFVMEVIESLDQ
ncbi:MAG TPA: glyoxalase/bleomycin resistance/dioxygenase family protein [Firmicutes bacterium]|nr:glyoxalase/bleomycin resistance/dioxygenase family protein [Bacillota bacterium]